ncbi:MAG TPA: NUDIX domain-containing protein [Trebonia sp.]|nr:NUDIX domain-containing protein [Trebonia sp.]
MTGAAARDPLAPAGEHDSRTSPADSLWRGFPPTGVRESRNPRAFPSGRVEAGESAEQAAAREAEEETGWRPGPLMLSAG